MFWHPAALKPMSLAFQLTTVQGTAPPPLKATISLVLSQGSGHPLMTPAPLASMVAMNCASTHHCVCTYPLDQEFSTFLML